MHEISENPKQVLLIVMAAIIIALTVGFAVVRLSGGSTDGADAPPPDGSGDGGGEGAPNAGFDVAELLPDSEPELRDAADAASAFTEAYFSNKDDRASRLAELSTPEYADMAAAESEAPPVLGEKVRPKASDTRVTVEVTGIRALSEGGVTYIVKAVTETKGRKQTFESAVSLAERKAVWKVQGFQDAAVGDHGAV